MSILLKNPEAERMARELAALRGSTLTDAIKGALDKALAEEKAKTPRTRESMIAANDRFRKAAGLDKPHPPITKADFDALYDYLDEEMK
jgi:hypothetical protein